ncbi:MAG: hypothetical protein H6Q08_75 [Acidobacteria bacterium]|jgi:hypothetical protein|nr:hypothetical protein [Acidobacteriota bacterium]
MRFTSSSRQSTGRRLVLALAVVVALAGLGASAWAQEAQQQAAPQQQQAAPGLTFGTDAGIIFNMIKPDKTADFEGIMAKVKEALAKSDNPVRKQQAASWKVFKVQEPAPNGNVFYLFVMDPAVKDADYTISKILYEAFPTEVQAMYNTLKDCYAGGGSKLSLQTVHHFGQ